MSGRGYRHLPLPEPNAPLGFGRMPLGRWFTVAGAVIAVMIIAGAVWAGSSLRASHEANSAVIDIIDPATLHTLRLATALSMQEGAARSYGRTADEQYLTSYRDSIIAERTAVSQITPLLGQMPDTAELRAELGRLTAATSRWRREFAEPLLIAATTVPDPTNVLTPERAAVNLQLFANARTALTTLEEHFNRIHEHAADRARSGAESFYLALIVAVALVLAGLLALALIVRYVVLRPVSELTAQVRAVASGDFEHRLQVTQPAELAELSGHVDSMRGRILSEWRRAADAQRLLEDQAAELRRSNGELEQFAYVASHDLQEPLRKVASFTQMLEQRYGDALDDRAKQYIAFSVDGAKRMQLLINDLLDFSRVGRVGGERLVVASGDTVRAATHNLSALLEEADATVVYDGLPQIYGNPTQLTQLFQNLVGNAVKFRSTEPPVIEIGAKPDGDMWEFYCSDNGIGIDAKYTDRIFLIFQRLHPRDLYPGTGIGLALCKKIVEYHGGTIWVDNDNSDKAGTTFRWTLPGVALAPGDTDE